MGRQQIMDMLALVLHDAEIMGKDTFGRERQLKVIKGINDKLKEYILAWQKSDEADYWQKRLDEALAEAYGEDAVKDSFHTRYEYAKEYDYKTGRWTK
jgi:hypothetical protein